MNSFFSLALPPYNRWFFEIFQFQKNGKKKNFKNFAFTNFLVCEVNVRREMARVWRRKLPLATNIFA